MNFQLDIKNKCVNFRTFGKVNLKNKNHMYFKAFSTFLSISFTFICLASALVYLIQHKRPCMSLVSENVMLNAA